LPVPRRFPYRLEPGTLFSDESRFLRVSSTAAVIDVLIPYLSGIVSGQFELNFQIVKNWPVERRSSPR